MDSILVLGLVLMIIYIVGQFSFIFYSQAAYRKLRNEIISKGRLISLIPVLTVTTVTSMPGGSVPHSGVPGAPPGYTATVETKSQPPAYVP